MRHFYQEIPGWFSFRPLYEQIVREAKDGVHFVEVGSWKGRSAAFMAVEIANSGKKISFDCVDTWLGSQEAKHLEDPAVKNGTLFDEFRRNVEAVKDSISIIRKPSVEAAAGYEFESLDFVFIDAAHDFENVLTDIRAWWPKIRPGGVLAGDDIKKAEVARAVGAVFGKYYQTVPGTGTGAQWKVTKLF